MADAIGQLMEFWNFKSNLGRIWTLLYLSPEPVPAAEISESLNLSAGAVSMATNELLRWKAIRKIHQPGERRDFFTAETDLWKLITGVLSDRERRESIRPSMPSKPLWRHWTPRRSTTSRRISASRRSGSSGCSNSP
jgi:transcriptional regulator, ArsR family